jgi:hypothetical protein
MDAQMLGILSEEWNDEEGTGVLDLYGSSGSWAGWSGGHGRGWRRLRRVGRERDEFVGGRLKPMDFLRQEILCDWWCAVCMRILYAPDRPVYIKLR